MTRYIIQWKSQVRNRNVNRERARGESLHTYTRSDAVRLVKTWNESAYREGMRYRLRAVPDQMVLEVGT